MYYTIASTEDLNNKATVDFSQRGNKYSVELYKRETKDFAHKEFAKIEDADLSDIADRLNSLADYAYSYRIGNQVLGMPIETFKNLMHKAANLVLANT